MRRESSKNRKRKVSEDERDENVREYDMLIRVASAIVLIAAGVLLALAAFGQAGPAGGAAIAGAYALVGIGAFLLPIALITVGLYAGFGRPALAPLTASGLGLILASVLTFAGLFPGASFGGVAGTYAGGALAGFFGFWGALVLLFAAIALGIAVVSDVEALTAALLRGFEALRGRLSRGRYDEVEVGDVVGIDEDSEEPYPEPEGDGVIEAETEAEPTVNVFNDQKPRAGTGGIANFDAAYNPPPLSILGEDRGRPGVGDIKANANIIKRTFQNFGINVEMDEVSVGPTVTRYAVKPAEGVRLSKIVSLANNLELALAAHPVRIEAPIPGKSLVGIEVPNATKAMVGLGGVLGSGQWRESSVPLLAALGRDITGTSHFVNIGKMPHALVAGATGSGKSVAIHALITSLLYRNGPDQLRFILIDPKRVELTLYNGIPHLLTPVITDPKRAILALRWAGKEMERRYNILEAERVRDIDSYHRSVYEPAKKRGGRSVEEMPEALPYLVVVIDELADIMASYPRDLEAAIVRLAQMSRAVGIHLVLSTQRPSVNVITGLIKANVPTRLALQVASQIDSRTILDGSGAETLLGAGDMLYLSGDMGKPVRLQTAFISEGEVKKVVNYIKTHNAGSLAAIELGGGPLVNNGADTISLASFDDDDEIDDDLYQDAKVAVEEVGRASTSYLQRKLKIGYSRAARLMDVLEARGVIGPADGSKPREVLGHVPSGASEADDL
jgi:S-DNA-T family DNA segregation ATPase FtsK/SpoIIIE